MIEAEKANYNLQLRYVELAKSIEPIETKIKTTFAQVLLDHEDQILACLLYTSNIVNRKITAKEIAGFDNIISGVDWGYYLSLIHILKLIASVCRSQHSIRTAKHIVKNAIRNEDISYEGLRAAAASTPVGRI